MSGPIEILWQTASAIAVNKPPGIATQSPQEFHSVETQLRSQLGRDELYLAFPHRLDRSVSGVLLAALTKRAARLLSEQFATRKTCKRYIALVEGTFESGDEEVVWEDHLRKVPTRPVVEVCGLEDSDAKLAKTYARSMVGDSRNETSRLQLRPVTGRMHQLRLQCSLRGHPIVGDDLYGASKVDSARIMLHADRLEFFDPKSGKRTLVEAECPF